MSSMSDNSSTTVWRLGIVELEKSEVLALDRREFMWKSEMERRGRVAEEVAEGGEESPEEEGGEESPEVPATLRRTTPPYTLPSVLVLGQLLLLKVLPVLPAFRRRR